MRLSTPLWLLNMLLDMSTKSACCYFLFSDYRMALCLGILWSSLHLFCLLLASGLMSAFAWPRFVLFGLTLLIANALFVGILSWSTEADIAMPKDVSQSAVILVSINLLSILMSSAIDALAKFVWRSSSTGRISMIVVGPAEKRRLASLFDCNAANSLLRFWLRIHEHLRAEMVFVVLVVVPVALPVAGTLGYVVRYVYRTNYVCAPGNHIIRSETDAIEAAKKGILSGHGSRMSTFGSIPEFVEALGKNKKCCSARITRNRFFIFVWEVSLNTLPETKHHPDATVLLSNCGDVFDSGTYLDAD